VIGHAHVTTWISSVPEQLRWYRSLKLDADW